MRIGIDLGGTKIESIAIDDEGRELARKRMPTPRHYDGTLVAIGGIVRDFEKELADSATVGIGMPGTISPATGVVKNANSIWLNGRPLAQDASRVIGRPLRFANDANCFALSEATDGAAVNVSLVFGVILGTGTGGGIVRDRRIWTGSNAIGGEWGHNPMPWPEASEWPGPACYCGLTGCIETFLSGPGMAREHRELTGETFNAAEIAARADAGDANAIATMERYERRLARGLAHVINLLDPEMIVLGGGLSNVTRLYENVPKIWGGYVFSDTVNTRLVAPAHGDASGVRGAAWLWSREEVIPPMARTSMRRDRLS